jgi:biopolymer transport protein TolQ
MNVPIIDMVLRSGWAARTILILLGIFSVITWAVIFNRLSYLGKATKRNKQFLKKYAGCVHVTDIEKIDKQLLQAPMGLMGIKGIAEYKRILTDAQSHTGVKDWSFFIQNQFAITLELMDSLFSELSRSLDKGLIVLAISASVCPFLGLLGTVWGIMNSFFEIGNQGSASLPVVAPGIAEALITTLVGLAVAIPAVLFYNYFLHRVERLENEANEYKGILFSHVKRDVLSVLYGERPKTPTMN